MTDSPRKLYGNYKKLQDIYEIKGLYSTEFYNQTIAYVKKLLNKYLIQKQFNEDNIQDCFMAIYEKVSANYDSEKGVLGTFIHTIVRNYCTKVNYRLKNHQAPISLDFEYIDKEEVNNKSSFNEVDIMLEDEELKSPELDSIENYCSDLADLNIYESVEYLFDVVNYVKNLKEISHNNSSNNINKIDAIRKDLTWNIWKQWRTPQ